MPGKQHEKCLFSPNFPQLKMAGLFSIDIEEYQILYYTQINILRLTETQEVLGQEDDVEILQRVVLAVQVKHPMGLLID